MKVFKTLSPIITSEGAPLLTDMATVGDDGRGDAAGRPGHLVATGVNSSDLITPGLSSDH